MNRKKENGERSILVYYCGKKGQNSDSHASGTFPAQSPRTDPSLAAQIVFQSAVDLQPYPRMSQCLSVSLLTEN
jgi:hypothetical protein